MATSNTPGPPDAGPLDPRLPASEQPAVPALSEPTLPPAVSAPAEPVAAAPAVSTPPVAPATYASLGDRMLATFLDLLVLLAVFWVVGMWLAPAFGGLTAEGFNVEGRPALIVLGLASVIFFAYYVCLEWWFSTTLGKVVAGVRVVGADGGRLDLGRSLLRNLLRVIDAVGVYLVAAVLVLLTTRRQRLGDVIAHTVVVGRDYPRYGRVAALLVLLALPVAAIAGAWSLRASRTGPSTTEVTTSTTSGSAASASAVAGGGATSPGAAVATASLADGPLTVANLRAAEGPEGPDRPSASYKPGETSTLRFDVSGFDTGPGTGRVRISFTARDPFGVAVIQPAETVQEPPAGKTSLQAWARISLPEYAWPGTYVIDLTVADLAANRQVRTSVPFIVEGLPVEPSDTLTLRNFRLTEGENGSPRSNAIYRKGETLWAAFDVVGFKADADGTIRLKEEAVVASGDQRSPEQALLDLHSRFSYVPRRIPVTNHLTLTDMSSGDYVLTLVFTDAVGNQRFEQPVRFTILP